MSVTIFHNPRCSKSRAALDLVRKTGVEPEVVEYLKTNPSFDEIQSLLKLLGLEPRKFMRKGEAIYKEAGLADSNLSRDQLIQAMVDHPILIERPIVIANGKAAIGRPPEKVLEIL